MLLCLHAFPTDCTLRVYTGTTFFIAPNNRGVVGFKNDIFITHVSATPAAEKKGGEGAYYNNKVCRITKYGPY